MCATAEVLNLDESTLLVYPDMCVRVSLILFIGINQADGNYYIMCVLVYVCFEGELLGIFVCEIPQLKDTIQRPHIVRVRLYVSTLSCNNVMCMDAALGLIDF